MSLSFLVSNKRIATLSHHRRLLSIVKGSANARTYLKRCRFCEEKSNSTSGMCRSSSLTEVVGYLTKT